MDATGLADAIRRGETTAVAVMQASIERIRARSDLGAVRVMDTKMGLAGAEAFDDLLRRRSRRALGAPFGGLPFLMKDLGNAARGLPPAACSPAIVRFNAEHPESLPQDSVLVRRLRRAGLVPFGLTVTPELGLALSSEPRGLPPCRNPWNGTLSPGGSSGGAAAAVAAGLVPIAHATDAAGSIRVPAAACGLYGLKPTRSATPNGPTFGNELLGLVGELAVARSVRDLVAMFTAVAGDVQGPSPDAGFASAVPGELPLRIGVIDAAPGMTTVGAREAAAVSEALDRLIAAGHKPVPMGIEAFADLARRANRVVADLLTVSAADWMAAIRPNPSELSPLAAAVVDEGARMPATVLFALLREVALISHALWRLFETVDVILTPMLANGPFPLGSFPMDGTDTAAHWKRLEAVAPYAAIANIGGLPALSLPFGAAEPGLPPPAVQILGPMGADRLLLTLGGILAAARPAVFPAPIAGIPA